MRLFYTCLLLVVFGGFPCFCGCSQKAEKAPPDSIPTSESEFDTPPEQMDPNNV